MTVPIKALSALERFDINYPSYVCPVDGWRPPECEATVGDLIETGSLSVRQLLVLHRLLKTTRLLPEIVIKS